MAATDRIFPLDTINLGELERKNTIYQAVHRKRKSHHGRLFQAPGPSDFGDINDGESLKSALNAFDKKFSMGLQR